MSSKAQAIIFSVFITSLLTYCVSKQLEHETNFLYDDVRQPNWSEKFPMINDSPIIGILTLPLQPKIKVANKTRFFRATYAKFLQAPGARVVPVFHDLSVQELQSKLSKLNGIFLTGGEAAVLKPGTQFDLTAYGRSVQTIVNYSREQLKNNKYFPIWGTCLGFETLHVILASSGKAIGDSYAQFVNLTLKFNQEFRRSGVYRYFDTNLIETLQKTPLTFNQHHQGIPLKLYEDQQLGLGKIFNVLTTSVDLNGQQIVTSVSGRELPIYGAQYHPEKAQYDLYEGINIPHEIAAIQTSMNLAKFFVFEARRNELKMNFEEANKVIIENFQVHVFNSQYGQLYLF